MITFVESGQEPLMPRYFPNRWSNTNQIIFHYDLGHILLIVYEWNNHEMCDFPFIRHTFVKSHIDQGYNSWFAFCMSPCEKQTAFRVICQRLTTSKIWSRFSRKLIYSCHKMYRTERVGQLLSKYCKIVFSNVEANMWKGYI